MTTKHTAGPWNRNIKPATKYPVIYAGRNTHVAQVCTAGLTPEEIEANCDLIAAAPELLEAIRYLVGADNDIQAHRGGKHDQAMNRLAALDMAARAIAKATGKETPS